MRDVGITAALVVGGLAATQVFDLGGGSPDSPRTSGSGTSSGSGAGSKPQSNGGGSAQAVGGTRIITAPHLEAMRESPAAGAAKELFDNSDTYVAKFRDGQRFPEGWDSKQALLYTSYEEFAADAKRGIGDDIDAVIYDNEEWDRTPISEREDPETAARKFKELAHANDLTFIAAPAPGIPGTRLFDADAKHADTLVIQAQNRQARPDDYRKMVAHATRAAKAVNPDVEIIAEISSNPEKLAPSGVGSDAGGDDVRRAVRSVAGSGATQVDGIWPWTYSSTPAGLKHGIDMVQELARGTGTD